MKTKNYLQVQDRMVSFFDTGNKHNNVIVLVTSFPLTKECWNEQVEQPSATDKAYPELSLNPLSIVLMLMFEGVVGSTIISFVTLQFYKDRMRNAA